MQDANALRHADAAVATPGAWPRITGDAIIFFLVPLARHKLALIVILNCKESYPCEQTAHQNLPTMLQLFLPYPRPPSSMYPATVTRRNEAQSILPLGCCCYLQNPCGPWHSGAQSAAMLALPHQDTASDMPHWQRRRLQGGQQNGENRRALPPFQQIFSLAGVNSASTAVAGPAQENFNDPVSSAEVLLADDLAPIDTPDATETLFGPGGLPRITDLEQGTYLRNQQLLALLTSLAANRQSQRDTEPNGGGQSRRFGAGVHLRRTQKFAAVRRSAGASPRS